jgi:hypothetical protein
LQELTMCIQCLHFRYLKSTLGNIRLIGLIRMDETSPAETNEKKVRFWSILCEEPFVIICFVRLSLVLPRLWQYCQNSRCFLCATPFQVRFTCSPSCLPTLPLTPYYIHSYVLIPFNCCWNWQSIIIHIYLLHSIVAVYVR